MSNSTFPEPRSSTETDRTLSSPEGNTLTPRATSPAQTLVDTSNTDTSYRGFPSRAHYLAALQEWAEEKRYLQPSHMTLDGFYGNTTLETYANRPKHEFGISRKLREKQEKKQTRQRSAWLLGLRKAS